MRCYCNSNQAFANCCQPLLTANQSATSAEQLMRSRYSAYASGNVDYLIRTLAPEKQRANEKQAILESIKNTQWLGLKIIDYTASGSKSKTDFVEFVAFFSDKGIQQLHEKSRFEKRQGEWFYLDGKILNPLKLSRNDPCFCGSGKKLKRCHFASI